ncbi:MAG: hypothetical protein JNM50_05660 [Chromatiales bacterium]|jgi:hypothetical protein|nr:hypothetical protein [Chromatiales bacterium]
MSQTIAAPVETEVDPARFFWYGVWALIMVATALPMLDLVRVPRVLPYTATLVIHELMAFLYFGHTFFSNIWSLVIRKTQPQPVGVWARGFLRKLCLGVTAPTAVIVPLMGLMLMEDWGGLVNNPWAWDAYFAFWLMAGFSVVPDVIRYARNRNAGNPMHGMMSGGIRGMLALVATLYILIYCMVMKGSLFAEPMLAALGVKG